MKKCSYCGKEYSDGQTVCPIDATPLDAPSNQLSGPQSPTPTAAQASEIQPSAFPARAALVTLAVLAVCFAGQRVPIPFVPSPAEGRSLIFGTSIFALGVRPLLVGFILVELAALLVSDWRPLRTGGPAGRAKLRRAAVRVGMFLALGQAFVLTQAFAATVASNYSASDRMLTVLTLLGATAALVLLARVVDEAGLGGGFPVLLLAFTVPDIGGALRHAFLAFHQGLLATSALQIEAFGLALLVGATLWFFTRYSLPLEAGEDPALLSRPACGVVPVSFVAFLLSFLTRQIRVYTGQNFNLPWQFQAVPVLLSIFAAIGFAYLFNLPDRVRVMWQALSPVPPERVPRVKPFVLECVIFISLVMIVQAWLGRCLGYGNFPHVVDVILVTGIVADLIRELRAKAQGPALVPIWEIHQVYGVPPAMRLLQAQGFHPFAKGLRLRSLLQFFGPFAPVLVLVPFDEAQAARRLLEARWPALDEPTPETQSVPPPWHQQH